MGRVWEGGEGTASVRSSCPLLELESFWGSEDMVGCRRSKRPDRVAYRHLRAGRREVREREASEIGKAF